MTNDQPGINTALLDQLRERLGEDCVGTAQSELDYFAMDVFARGEPLSAVIRPSDDRALKDAVGLLAAAGIPMIGRGGGLSYTDAYLASRPGSVLIDTGALDRIVEINAQDRYAVVECGVTWAQLDAALEASGLRTPYFGPLSGLEATIGGALAQGSVFLGSGRYGSVADSVLSLDVITPTGELIRTGAAAAADTPPFFRYFGPDLTGVFVGDAGTLGIKLRASLRLIERPEAAGFRSWQAESADEMFELMSQLARSGLPSECFGFDPLLAEMRVKRASIGEGARAMQSVVRRQGLLSGLTLAVRGRGFLDTSCYSVHAVIEASDRPELRARLKQADRRCARSAARPIAASIPQALRANPFTPPNTMLGPSGERWVPVHGILPHSRAKAAYSALRQALDDNADTLERHLIQVGFLFATVGQQATLIEPVFYWPDSHTPYHRRRVEPAHRQRIGEADDNPAARTEVARLKRLLADILRSHGAVHFQIGKFYNWRDGMNPAARALHDAIKRALDPQDLMNPGALA